MAGVADDHGWSCAPTGSAAKATSHSGGTGRERKQPHPGIEPQPTARSITIGPSEGADKAFSDVYASANRPSRRLFFHGVICPPPSALPLRPGLPLIYAVRSSDTGSQPSPSSSGIGSAGYSSSGGPRIAKVLRLRSGQAPAPPTAQGASGLS
jgi:hypothetical protein